MTLLLIAIFNTKGGAALYFITYVLNGDATYQALFFGTATAGGFWVRSWCRRYTGDTTCAASISGVNLILVAGHFAAFFVPGDYPTCGWYWSGCAASCWAAPCRSTSP